MAKPDTSKSNLTRDDFDAGDVGNKDFDDYDMGRRKKKREAGDTSMVAPKQGASKVGGEANSNYREGFDPNEKATADAPAKSSIGMGDLGALSRKRRQAAQAEALK